jgi:hypothetical protein
MPRTKRILLGLSALSAAGMVWLLGLHCFFTRSAESFHTATGLSPAARELAARHLQLWTEPDLRRQELGRMRASNAEWDFMGRSFLVWSLANMALREPASRGVYLEAIDRIIDETLRLEKQEGFYFFLMSYAKARPFVMKPERSLFLDGEIAMMLAARRLAEEKPEYRSLLTERVNLMAERFQASRNHVLESYPDECWMFDHAVALAAIRMADHLDGTDHLGLCVDWIEMAKRKLVDRESGLLVSSFTTDAEPLDGPEGSSLWMVAHCLQLVDPEFARDQYARARRELGRTTLGFSYAREWPASWKGPQDIDSGPIIPVFQISAGSSGMAFIGASAFDDREFLASLSATLDFAAFPSRKNGSLKYCASNQVGDAALLYAATLGPLWQKVQSPTKR